MKIKGRFEVQEREDLAHLSVEGHISCDGIDKYGNLLNYKLEIEPEDKDKFLKLVLTVMLNDERHFDFIVLDKSDKLPGLIIIWNSMLFDYFDVPNIDD